MSNTNEKRRKVFIDKAFQGRFILNVIVLIMLSSLCSALIIYWITGGDLQAEAQSAHQNIANALDHLGFSIVIANLAAMLLVGILTALMVLYVSHKIAGPLYRFEKLCQQIGDGQLDTITKLRQGDQLQDMGRAFEDMVIKLRDRRDQRRALLVRLSAQLEQIMQDPAVASRYSTQIEQIRKELRQLQE